MNGRANPHLESDTGVCSSFSPPRGSADRHVYAPAFLVTAAMIKSTGDSPPDDILWLYPMQTKLACACDIHIHKNILLRTARTDNSLTFTGISLWTLYRVTSTLCGHHWKSPHSTSWNFWKLKTLLDRKVFFFCLHLWSVHSYSTRICLHRKPDSSNHQKNWFVRWGSGQLVVSWVRDKEIREVSVIFHGFTNVECRWFEQNSFPARKVIATFFQNGGWWFADPERGINRTRWIFRGWRT